MVSRPLEWVGAVGSQTANASRSRAGGLVAMNKLTLFLMLTAMIMLTSPALAQDVSPLRDYHVWLPMTGMTEGQLDDAPLSTSGCSQCHNTARG